jgi:N-acetylglucosaminylphosphatidylinositol deacetylase
VTSHPDDETMFFGPTILSMTRGSGVAGRTRPDVFLLCMSNGNFRNNGRERKEELYKACQVLNIPEQNVTIMR